MSEVLTNRLPAPWGEHELPRDEPLRLELGPLTVWSVFRTGEIWIAYAPGDWTRPRRAKRENGHSGERRRRGEIPWSAGSRPDRPDNEAWIRWPVPADADRISLTPCFPPRPVVAEPELSFRLLPRARARIYVRVPLWVRIHALSRDPEPLIALPTVVLSDTWWGAPTAGELAFWLQTTARRSHPREVFEPHLVVCPLELSNPSADELPVERIALRVAYLSVFAEEGRLWSDETKLRYQGADEGSRIDVSGAAPREVPQAVRVVEPREPPPSRGFRARSFARLKAVYGLGGVE